MTYKAWTQWLEEKSLMPSIAPGLDKTINALKQAQLYDKLQAQKNIIVAGTNGKGTTAKILEQLLLAAGQKVGLYTSPHLISTCERIRTNNHDISEKDFVLLCEKYQGLIEELKLSHFESLTLFAVDYFLSANSDWNIFEVGMGGTWDATNAIPHKYSVITTLGLDHQDILGHSIEEIAANKFGIIQKNNIVFHRNYNPSLMKQLNLIIKNTHATSIPLPQTESSIEILSHYPFTEFITPWGKAQLSLPGQRAAENALQALTVFFHLGYSPQEYLTSLQHIDWPGRLSLLNIDSPCPIYLSGDHNEQGILSLYESLKHRPYDHIHFLIGTSKNRPAKKFIEVLKLLPNSHFTLTRPSFMGTTPQEQDYLFVEDPIKALQKVLLSVKSHDLVVVTGSLYLCGDILQYYSHEHE